MKYLILRSLLFLPEALQAQKVFIAEYDSQADKKVYFVEYDSQAGWRNTDKQHLLF